MKAVMLTYKYTHSSYRLSMLSTALSTLHPLTPPGASNPVGHVTLNLDLTNNMLIHNCVKHEIYTGSVFNNL